MLVVVIYLFYPSTCYDLNYHVERHAYQTYEQFLNDEGEKLKMIKEIPKAAVEYYSSNGGGNRKLESLYDVFVNIRDDELEHSNMMYDLREEFMKNNE